MDTIAEFKGWSLVTCKGTITPEDPEGASREYIRCNPTLYDPDTLGESGTVCILNATLASFAFHKLFARTVQVSIDDTSDVLSNAEATKPINILPCTNAAWSWRFRKGLSAMLESCGDTYAHVVMLIDVPCDVDMAMARETLEKQKSLINTVDDMKDRSIVLVRDDSARIVTFEKGGHQVSMFSDRPMYDFTTAIAGCVASPLFPSTGPAKFNGGARLSSPYFSILLGCRELAPVQSHAAIHPFADGHTPVVLDGEPLLKYVSTLSTLDVSTGNTVGGVRVEGQSGTEYTVYAVTKSDDWDRPDASPDAVGDAVFDSDAQAALEHICNMMCEETLGTRSPGRDSWCKVHEPQGRVLRESLAAKYNGCVDFLLQRVSSSFLIMAGDRRTPFHSGVARAQSIGASFH